jgi:hypothetical protein
LSLLLQPGGSAEFGAKGDGVSDDTAAIRAAIADPNLQARVLFFPKGTCAVSDTLDWLRTDKTWRSRLTFQGENERGTIIRLKDNAPGYQDPGAPKAVIRPPSK